MSGIPSEQEVMRGKRTRGLSLLVAAIFLVVSGLKMRIKLMVWFVISVVVAYRLLDIGMYMNLPLGVESAAAFGSQPQQ
jgi:hypothetical protein